MQQNTFGGRAPRGPAGGACALPQTPSHNGGPLLRGGTKGKGRQVKGGILIVRGGRGEGKGTERKEHTSKGRGG